MPEYHKNQFYDHKDRLREFNDVIRDVIDTGASKFSFDELLGFMTKMYVASNGQEHVNDFQKEARQVLFGMRDEVSFEQVLKHAATEENEEGFDFRLATSSEDAKGADFFINDIPIDLKSSEVAVRRARQKTHSNLYSGTQVIWSHINPEDYKGGLVPPFEMYKVIWKRVKPDLDQALTSNKQLVSV